VEKRTADLIEKIKPYTKSDVPRLMSMLDALKLIDQKEIPGDVVEVGVWRGGNIMLARLLSPQRRCWLYDTFDGMTVPSEFDVKRSGDKAIDRYNLKRAGGTKWDAVSLEEVKNGFRQNKIDPLQLNFIVGPVELTAPLLRPQTIALLRLDVDWYAPTKVALEQLYPKLSAGGILIVDDYGHWMGCAKAVDEYFEDSAPPFEDVDYSCRIFFKC
jgi:O-methyltransferase